MARLPDDAPNPNAADFDCEAITDWWFDATADRDPDATTRPTATADDDPDATDGLVRRPVSRRRTRRGRPYRPPAARLRNSPGSPATRSWGCW